MFDNLCPLVFWSRDSLDWAPLDTRTGEGGMGRGEFRRTDHPRQTFTVFDEPFLFANSKGWNFNTYIYTQESSKFLF